MALGGLNDRFKREPFSKDNFVVAGIPVHSGDAHLTASGTPARSAVQVEKSLRETGGLERVSDFSAVVSEPGAIPLRGNAGGLCHFPQTADVDGELRDRLEQELILAFDATVPLLLGVRRQAVVR